MTDSDQTDLVAELATEIDPLVQRILTAKDLLEVRDLVQQVRWHCMQPPYFEHMWGAGELYAIWGELDDILDRWPVDYGPDAETIAIREFRRGAKEWLAMPRTEVGIRNYTHQWRTRLAERTWG